MSSKNASFKTFSVLVCGKPDQQNMENGTDMEILTSYGRSFMLKGETTNTNVNPTA